METQQVDKTEQKEGKGALIVCFVLFTTFLINVIFGKLNIAYGLGMPHLGNVAEFLLLTLASVSLIVAALKNETAEKQFSTQEKEELK